MGKFSARLTRLKGMGSAGLFRASRLVAVLTNGQSIHPDTRFARTLDHMIKYRLLLLLVLGLASCQAQERSSVTSPPSHDRWDALLRKHVDASGMVDYKGFLKDREELENYLDQLSRNAPDPETWTEEERVAYWINAYNAFTVKLIIDNYPVKSIQDLHPTIHVPGVSTVWHKKFFTIGGKETSLDEIEHDILRKKFNEPRIHFAINCASFSCPPLRSEAYTAPKLDAQLDEMARRFINDPDRNRLSPDNPALSKIFSWFTGDFTRTGSLISFINQYASIQINEDADVDYLEYDWALNEAE